MKIGQLLQSEIFSHHTIVEVWKRSERISSTKWIRLADGYKDDEEVLKFVDFDISEFYYKSYPEEINIYI